MTDSIAVLSVAERITLATGVPPENGAKIYFYESGTSTPLPVYADAELTVLLGSTVYTDSGGFPVTAEGSTTKTQIYTGASSYKVIISEDTSDSGFITLDNVKGALDTSDFSGGGTVLQQVPVVAKSASYTVLVAENGTLFDVNCTGGNATMTLPSAIDAGDGFYVGFRHNGTANAVIPATVSSQTIRHTANTGAASLPTKVALTGKGETIWIASDGANWVVYSYVPALINNTTGVIVIADRLSAPPSHVAGARYILGSSPSGAWSTFAQHDIAESDGTAWFKRTPPTDCGWLAYVQDEDIFYFFRGTAWVPETATSTQQGTVKVSTQAIQETGTATDAAVLTGHQKFHPLHAKVYGVADANGTLLEGNGISSIGDTGTGQVTFNFTTPFSTTNYCPVGTAQGGTSTNRSFQITTKNLGSVLIASANDLGNLTDQTSYNLIVLGDV